MKHLVKLCTIALMAMICGTASAQTLKFGHINMQEIMALMAERDSAVVKLEAYGKSLQEDLQTLRAEFQTKYVNYEKNASTWTAAILEQKQRELNEMSQRLQDFEQTANQDFSNMQMTLMRPVMEKANDAVAKYGKANGFIYILDVSTGAFPFYNPDISVDVTADIKKALNIPLDKKLPVATQE